MQVPGDGAQYYDSKPVPHGLVQIMTYESKATGATRQAYVYTPPDYTRTTAKYPVFYLLHGGGDLDPGWVMTGRANIIMDNLLAEKKAVPMIVVMPLARGGGSLGIGPSGMSPGFAAAGNVVPGEVAAALLRLRAPRRVRPPRRLRRRLARRLSRRSRRISLAISMPAVEKTFRASSRPDDRAIGGLSAGGAATVNTAFSRPDLFRYIIILSAGAPQNLEELYPKFFGNAAAAAKQMKLVWLAAGDEDFALNGTKTLDEVLTKNGVKHSFKTTQGRHEWRLWRPHLYEFAQLLFKDRNRRGLRPSTPLHALSRAASPARSVRVAHSLPLVRCQARAASAIAIPPMH